MNCEKPQSEQNEMRAYENTDIENVSVTNEQLYKDINDYMFDIPHSDEDISFETNDYEEQVTNDNEEQKDDVIDSSDNEDFETKDEGEMLLTQLLKDIKKKFGSKEANIELFSNTERNSPSCVDNISINFLKEKVASFTKATLDLKIDLVPNKNTEAILQNCTRVHNKIKEFDAIKAVTQVAMFAFFLKMYDLMKEAQRSPEVKEFNKSLQLKLECKSSQQFSKYKRKCKRVNQLAELVGRACATLFSIYVTIFMLENAKDMEWN